MSPTSTTPRLVSLVLVAVVLAATCGSNALPLEDTSEAGRAAVDRTDPQPAPPAAEPAATAEPPPPAPTADPSATAEAPEAAPPTESPPSTSTTVDPNPLAPIAVAPGEVVRIVVAGDSVARQVIPHLRQALGATAEVRDLTWGGAALCDFFALEHNDTTSWRPHVVVIDFGGNALTPCMQDDAGIGLTGAAYTAKYDADTRYAIGLAHGMGSRVLLVDQPANRGDPPAGTSGVFRTLADEDITGTVRFLSMWPVLSPNGFQQSDSCSAEEPGCLDGRGELRSPPPGGHLEALGKWRYAVAIGDELAALGWLGR